MYIRRSPPPAPCETLANIRAVYETLRPAERKELMQLVLRRVEVNERQIVLEIYGGACA